MLDDLGLGPAIKTLAEDFQARTGITCDFATVVFRNRLDNDAKIALYRIAQEALTNIERHAGASDVAIDLDGYRTGATMRITDNGKGFELRGGTPGLGQRNMQERMEQLGGSSQLRPAVGKGVEIKAIALLTHMLPPDPGGADSKKSAA